MLIKSMAVIALVIIFTTLIIMAPIIILVRFISLTLAQKISSNILKFLLVLWFDGITVTRNSDIDKHTVYACKHVSMLDPLIMYSILPSPKKFLSSFVIFKHNPLIGVLAWIVGTIFVKRSDKDSRTKALEKLKTSARNSNIVIYPEGKISNDVVLPFRQGFAKIAEQTDMSVTPVIILGMKKNWFETFHTNVEIHIEASTKDYSQVQPQVEFVWSVNEFATQSK